MVKKIENTCNRLDTISAYDRQTDRQTERRTETDGQTDILRRHSPRYAYASRGKMSVPRLLVTVHVFCQLKCAAKCTQTYYFGDKQEA